MDEILAGDVYTSNGESKYDFPRLGAEFIVLEMEYCRGTVVWYWTNAKFYQRVMK